MALPAYKYQAHLCVVDPTLKQCPPIGSQSKQTVAYRFVFDPMTSNNFIPQGITKPSRIHETNGLEKRCSLYGISMHETLHGALKFFQGLEKSLKKVKVREVIGSHIAEGLIEPAHGTCSIAQKNGHFDLHEFVHTQVSVNFKIVKAIP